MLEIILLLIGFFLLIRGAEWLVDGSSDLAKKLGINDLLIGLTVVAFGTSLPELVVNLFASDAGSSELAISNVLGSNVANTLLILGVSAMFVPLTVHRLTVWREILFNVVATAMLIVLVADTWLLDSAGLRGLDRIDGLVLMSYFMAFLYYAFGRTTFASREPKPLLSKSRSAADAVPRIMFKIIVGSAAIYFGGRWIIDGSLFIIDQFSVAESAVGISVLALGTSLPELAASLTAVKRKKVDIAIGNVVGSNLFNLLWVLGLSATIRPLAFTTLNVFDAFIALAVAFILFATVAYGQFRHQISKFEGKIFLILYFLYLATLPFR